MGQFKSAKWKDKEHTINAPIFFTTLQKKKEMDAPNFLLLLADGQLLFMLLMLCLPLLDVYGLSKVI